MPTGTCVLGLSFFGDCWRCEMRSSFFELPFDIRMITAVTSVAVSSRSLGIPTVQNRAENARSVFGETLTGIERAFGCSFPRANHQNDAICEASQHSGIGEMDHGRCVNHDHVELLPHAGQ